MYRTAWHHWSSLRVFLMTIIGCNQNTSKLELEETLTKASINTPAVKAEEEEQAWLVLYTQSLFLTTYLSHFDSAMDHHKWI